MRKYQAEEWILKERLIGIIRTETEEQAYMSAKACIKGGFRVLEIPFTVPNAHMVIQRLKEEFGDGILIGAGTVLDPQTARTAILHGAEFMVCPNLNQETIQCCNRYGIVCMPGIATVTEAVKAMEWGCDILKVFPGSVMGISFIKAVKGPLPHALLCPTGGVSLNNAKEWLDAGSVGLGIGGSLTDGAENEDYAKIEETAKKFVSIVKNNKSA